MPDGLYHRDIMAWPGSQADRLRRVPRGERVNDVDRENVIEEIETLGRSRLKEVKALLVRGMGHVLKCHAWPERMAARKWRNEAIAFLNRGRREAERGTARYLGPAALHAKARRDVPPPDMRSPPRPLPERIALSVDELRDLDSGPGRLLPRITEGAPGAG